MWLGQSPRQRPGVGPGVMAAYFALLSACSAGSLCNFVVSCM